MKFKNSIKAIEREKELEEIIALKKALIKKNVISDADIKNEKNKK